MRISDWSSDVCSSDLTHRVIYVRRLCWLATRWRMTTVETIGRIRRAFRAEAIGAGDCASAPCVAQDRAQGDRGRSEEHTSELQSLMRISYDVFCLKKKK